MDQKERTQYISLKVLTLAECLYFEIIWLFSLVLQLPACLNQNLNFRPLQSGYNGVFHLIHLSLNLLSSFYLQSSFVYFHLFFISYFLCDNLKLFYCLYLFCLIIFIHNLNPIQCFPENHFSCFSVFGSVNSPVCPNSLDTITQRRLPREFIYLVGLSGSLPLKGDDPGTESHRWASPTVRYSFSAGGERAGAEAGERHQAAGYFSLPSNLNPWRSL